MNHPTIRRRRSTSVGRTSRLLAPALVTITVLLGASACAGGQSATAGVAVPVAAADAPAGEAGAAAVPEVSATVVKSCSLLTDAEIKAVIGTNSGGKGAAGLCEWTNEDNYHSVTVEIGDVNTAADGKLPDPLPGSKTEAGPDGIRFSSGNVAEFLIGDRACQVQVVTSVTDESDRPTQIKLIGLIRSRVKA